MHVSLLKKISFLIVGITITFCASAQNGIKPSITPKKDSTILKRKAVKVASTNQSDAPKKRIYSKIVNDSSKNVYGPKTTKWITEEDLFLNKKNYQPLDTSIHNFHRWTILQKLGNKYQDLGNVGTAMNPIFPLISTTIGASSGFKAYDANYETNELHHYDSKSPYTRIYLIWSGNGRAMTHIEFTRNITPRWNFGLNYRPILADKQIQRKFADRQTISHYYDFFTNYKSKNDKYSLVFNYRRIRTRIEENGGVALDKDTTFAAFFDPNAKPTLTTAESEDIRQNLHLYHHYQIAKPLQVYQAMDYNTQSNYFRMNRSDLASNYFKQTIIDSLKVTDEMSFKTFSNEAGLKGTAAFLFYNFYYKFRTVSNAIPQLKGYDPRASSSLVENYVGGRVAFRFDSLSELNASAELLLDGNYKLEGALTTPWLDASLTSVLAKPGYMQRAYRGSHNFWQNNFTNTFSNQLKGFLKVNWKGFNFSPGVTYTLLNNYIYFIKAFDGQRPVQSDGNQQILSPEVRLSVQFFKRFNFNTNAIYTKLVKNDGNVLRIPEVFVNTQFTYNNFFFKRALQMELGVDVHYKSDYLALGYAPDIQTYYLQDSHVIKSYPVIDVFMNAKIKGGRLFIKYHNAAQAGSTTGYLLTYGYPAVWNVIDFGFEIPLFD